VETRNSHFLFWHPHHISETNAARKLKFGVLAGIYYIFIHHNVIERTQQKVQQKSTKKRKK